jgi:zinc transport system permease protein
MRALLAGLGLAIVAAPLGCFVVWRRMAYYGETVAQAASSASPPAGALPQPDGQRAGRHARRLRLLVLLSRQQIVPFDSLLGLLAHAALAVGVIAASLVRGPQLDLMAFLFGDIFAITSTDLRWIYIGGAVALAALVSCGGRCCRSRCTRTWRRPRACPPTGQADVSS